MPTLHPLAKPATNASSIGRRPREQGFTLIEVMIVVAIVAILAGVALPAYTDYVRRGSLPPGFTLLSDYRIKMEQYYQDNRNYGAAACADGGSAPAWNTFPGGDNFTITCATAGQTYTLTATGAGRAAGHVYTINEQNQKRTTWFKGNAVAANCWLAKGSEC